MACRGVRAHLAGPAREGARRPVSGRSNRAARGCALGSPLRAARRAAPDARPAAPQHRDARHPRHRRPRARDLRSARAARARLRELGHPLEPPLGRAVDMASLPRADHGARLLAGWALCLARAARRARHGGLLARPDRARGARIRARHRLPVHDLGPDPGGDGLERRRDRALSRRLRVGYGRAAARLRRAPARDSRRSRRGARGAAPLARQRARRTSTTSSSERSPTGASRACACSASWTSCPRSSRASARTS